MHMHIHWMALLAVSLCLLPNAIAVTVYKGNVVPHWIADANGVTKQLQYRLQLPEGKTECVTIDTETGKRQATPGLNEMEANPLPAMDQPHPSGNSTTDTELTFINHLDVAVEIFWIDSGGKRVSYGRLPAGEKKVQHTYTSHVWLVATADGKLTAAFEATDFPATAMIDKSVLREPRKEQPAPDLSTHSPDGKWEAIVRDDNLFLRDIASGAQTQLTTDASPHATYARNGEIERGIEMDHQKPDPAVPTPEVFWSPDSRHLVAMRRTPGTQRTVHMVESSPRDQLQPKLLAIPYLKPGDDVPIRKPHLFDIATRREIPVDDALYANPWSISDVRWDAASSRFTFLFNQRGHQALRILAVNASTGAVTPIVDEESKTFINYSGKFFSEYLDDTGEIIWMSERDGWNHLYLYDAQTGSVKNQITRGQWVVRRVDFVDRKNRQIWLQAGGVIPGQDPYYLHCCRVNFDGSGFVVLTDGDGTHTTQVSPDRRFLLDTWSRVDQPPLTELRRCSDGKLVCKLEEALVVEKIPQPKPFVAKGRDGVTDIYGVLWFPAHFDPKGKYPVIEDIYAGPQDSFVPKGFSASFRQQKLADRGFIVVQIDGMGTSNRSRQFHDVCWKNLQDSGFPDRILWIQAAAAQFPAMDLTRVGIYGTSAGGQNALRGVLDHGDFYKAAVADSGCYDNRMDKIWWNEQWMGWPVDESYTRSSCVADAPKLKSKLLLMAGELDTNVDPASTLQVVNALIKADKEFDLLLAPGVGHGVLSTDYGWKRLVRFFEQNLRDAK